MDYPGQDPRGDLVRPFSLTRGRTQPASDIPLEAVLETTARGRQEAPFAGRYKHLIADLCAQQPQSVAEIAARTGVPLGVAKLWVADMATEQLLTVHNPTEHDGDYDDRMALLERVLDGLRKL